MTDKLIVLLVEPQKRPRVVEVEHTLEHLQKLVGGNIAASYPWEDRVAIVYDDEGLLKEKIVPNRYVEGIGVMVGTFFICGLGTEDFISLSDELLLKYATMFWTPERIVSVNGNALIFIDPDGTAPDMGYIKKVEHL